MLLAIKALAQQLAGDENKTIVKAIKGLLTKVSDDFSDLEHRLAATNCDLANYQNANNALLSQNEELSFQIEELRKDACCDNAKIAELKKDLVAEKKKNFSLEIYMADQELATQTAETKAAKTNPKGWKEIRNKLRKKDDTGEGPWKEVKNGRQTPKVGDVLSLNKGGKLSQSNVDGKTAEDLLEKFEGQIRSFNIIDGKVDQKVVELVSVTTKTEREAIYNHCDPCYFYKNGRCNNPNCTHPHFLIEKTTGKLYVQRRNLGRVKERLYVKGFLKKE